MFFIIIVNWKQHKHQPVELQVSYGPSLLLKTVLKARYKVEYIFERPPHF